MKKTKKPNYAPPFLPGALPLRIQPASGAEVHIQRGIALEEQGRWDDALQSYQQAVQCDPRNAHGHFNLGALLVRCKQYEEALAALDKVLALEPGNAEALAHRGAAYLGLQREEEAFASFNQALRIKPTLAEARYQVGVLLKKYKRLPEAIQQLKAAWQVNPEIPGLLNEMMETMMAMCDWSSLDAGMALIEQAMAQGKYSINPLNLAALRDAPAFQLQFVRVALGPDTAARTSLGPLPARKPGGKIRVGYYSADFRNHATTILMAELFELHDREHFEWFAFDFGPLVDDPMRRRVCAAFDHFIDVRGYSDEEVARMSREMGIDIAVDLKGFTQHHRFGIFAHRCAPVQVSWLGYPGTTGADYMDYVIADKVVLPPAAQPYYSEKVVYLPHSYQVNDRQRRIAERVFTRAEAGLPSDAVVFCCFNNNYKIQPVTFDGWMRILQAVPGSVLWLLEDNSFVALNLRREAQARGVAPERLVFAPRMELGEHLARHRLADLFLDTLPCNAHTTASDALWAGLPLLTCAGASFASRVAASLLHAVGLPELVTESQAEYEARAIALAQNPAQLKALRERLQAMLPNAPLFDAQRFARDIEAAFKVMYERHLQGFPLAVIEV